MTHSWQDLAHKHQIPMCISWELTWQCNLDCVHCYQFKPDLSKELSTNEIFQVMDQLAEAKTLFLVLTGGEPLTRKDFFEICEYARKLNFALTLMTNGTLVDEGVARKLKEISFKDIQVSLLGSTAETHDKITGHQGSFNQAVNALKLMKKEGLNVVTGVTLMRQNFDEYKEIIKLSESLGCHAFVSQFVFPRNDGKKDTLDFRLTDDQLATFIKTQEDVKPDDTFSLLCSAGRTGAAINAIGDVLACSAMPIPAGNLREQDFMSIWNDSELFMKIRNLKECDLEECPNCNRRDYCLRCHGQALLEDGNMYGPSAEACRYSKIIQEIQKR